MIDLDKSKTSADLILTNEYVGLIDHAGINIKELFNS